MLRFRYGVGFWERIASEVDVAFVLWSLKLVLRKDGKGNKNFTFKFDKCFRGKIGGRVRSYWKGSWRRSGRFFRVGDIRVVF